MLKYWRNLENEGPPTQLAAFRDLSRLALLLLGPRSRLPPMGRSVSQRVISVYQHLDH